MRKIYEIPQADVFLITSIPSFHPNRNEIYAISEGGEPRIGLGQRARPVTSSIDDILHITAIWRLAVIFIVPCVALWSFRCLPAKGLTYVLTSNLLHAYCERAHPMAYARPCILLVARASGPSYVCKDCAVYHLLHCIKRLYGLLYWTHVWEFRAAHAANTI